ncbi:FCD domain-containing protein [Acidimangrovimonas sediminis]|uniref:FCD domain-containing protein n=1 Tax=Acidimangrovimonas sediminis TaxID=2056283 RepID=UPI0018EDC7F4|nr:FCD domain-containing protein [Acidimangrovimonas sediminis]
MSFGIQTTQRRSLVEQVEGELRDALIEGRLEPGTRLVTRDLAETLGTSITPVREALVRLVASGALRAEPAQSFRVPRLTEGELIELAQIRKAVEGLAAREAAQKITAPEIAQMRVLLAEYIAARGKDDPHHALRCNRQFRFALYECAKMPHLQQVIETLWLKSGPGFNYLFPQHHNDFTGHRNYEDLIKALEAADGEAANLAICHAIEDGSDVVLRAMRAMEAATASAS